MAKQVVKFFKRTNLHRLRQNVHDDRGPFVGKRICFFSNSDLQEKNKGIIVRTFDHIINIINLASDKKFLVRCSYIEIYNEEIHDLLGKGYHSIDKIGKM